MHQDVSLILFVESGNTNQQLVQAVNAPGKASSRTQILLVDENRASKYPAEQIEYHPPPERFQNIGGAIAAAIHPIIAIADSAIEMSEAQWHLMVDQIEQSPIQTTYYSQRPEKPLVRNLLWTYSLFARLVLRTGKTELHPGLTVFNRDEVDEFLSEHQGCAAPGPFGISQLLALARLNGRKVSETAVSEPPANTKEHDLTLKMIGVALQNTLQFWWNQILYPRRESELPQAELKSSRKIAAVAVLMFLAAGLLFGSLNFPLFEPDETRNAQLALNIVDSGQWMSLTLAEKYYWDKPPLQIWAVAACYKLFGVNVFTTRLPVAIAAMLTLLFTLLIGKRLVGFRSAWLGALLLLLTSGFVLTGRYLTMDATLTAMATATLLCGFVAFQNKFDKRYAVAAGIACGLGIMVKGPVIGVICLPPLLASRWLASRQKRLPRSQWLWFAVPTFLIAAPWYIAMAVIHPDFLTYFFWKHHVVRFSDAFNHREPFWYYFAFIFIFMFPASYLIPSVVKFLTSQRPENRLGRTREQGFLFLSAIWIIGFFSISESKLPTYILPSFPPICLLMGVLLDRKIFLRPSFSTGEPSVGKPVQPGRKASATFLERLSFHAPVGVGITSVAISVAVLALIKPGSGSILTVAGCLIALTILVSLAVVKRSNPRIAWSCFGAIGLLMMSLALHNLQPALSNFRSMHLAAKTIQSTDEFRSAPIVFFGRENYGAGLQIDKESVFWFEATETCSMVEFLKANPSSIIVSSKDPMETLRQDLPWTILLEERTNARHLYVSRPNQTVIANQPASTTYR